MLYGWYHANSIYINRFPYGNQKYRKMTQYEPGYELSNRCIICTSPYVKEVDFMLTKKNTLASIQYFLQAKGVKLSTTSIARHRDNHFAKAKLSKNTQFKSKTRKKRAKSQSKDPTKSARQNEKIIKDAMDPDEHSPDYSAYKDNADKINRQKEILKEFTEDIDIISEFMTVLSLQKERAERARDEEEMAEAVLPTTGKAYDEYKKTLVDFHKITNGMESLKHLRLAELSQMMLGLFAKKCMTDQTRKELLDLIMLFNPDYKDKSISPILPTENITM